MTRESFVSLLSIALTPLPIHSGGAGIVSGIVTKRSRLSYKETLATLAQHITGGGNTIFATIDQAAAAQSAGTTLRPTTLIVFGNPKAGTPLMDAFPLVGLELPLKIQVWEEIGTVSLAYETLTSIAARYGVTGMDERVAMIDHAVDTLTNTVT
jgi:uncharacterized protein (DUF302 family)